MQGSEPNPQGEREEPARTETLSRREHRHAYGLHGQVPPQQSRHRKARRAGAGGARRGQEIDVAAEVAR